MASGGQASPASGGLLWGHPSPWPSPGQAFGALSVFSKSGSCGEGCAWHWTSSSVPTRWWVPLPCPARSPPSSYGRLGARRDRRALRGNGPAQLKPRRRPRGPGQEGRGPQAGRSHGGAQLGEGGLQAGELRGAAPAGRWHTAGGGGRRVGYQGGGDVAGGAATVTTLATLRRCQQWCTKFDPCWQLRLAAVPPRMIPPPTVSYRGAMPRPTQREGRTPAKRNNVCRVSRPGLGKGGTLR